MIKCVMCDNEAVIRSVCSPDCARSLEAMGQGGLVIAELMDMQGDDY